MDNSRTYWCAEVSLPHVPFLELWPRGNVQVTVVTRARAALWGAVRKRQKLTIFPYGWCEIIAWVGVMVILGLSFPTWMQIAGYSPGPLYGPVCAFAALATFIATRRSTQYGFFDPVKTASQREYL